MCVPVSQHHHHESQDCCYCCTVQFRMEKGNAFNELESGCNGTKERNKTTEPYDLKRIKTLLWRCHPFNSLYECVQHSPIIYVVADKMNTLCSWFVVERSLNGTAIYLCYFRRTTSICIDIYVCTHVSNKIPCPCE